MHRCHQKYGSIVRYSPDKVIFNSSTAVKDIYSRSANVQKSPSYRAFQTSPTALDLQSTVDKTQHDRKRRVISQAFSDTALKSLERYVLLHAEKLVRSLSEGAPNPHSGDDSGNENDVWTVAKNVAHWCTYVSFDYMTELVFGKAFNMLDTDTDHYILRLIDNSARRVGIILHMPWLASWKLDRYLAPKIRAARRQYNHTARKMAVDRMNTSTSRQDIFHYILSARDPETGQGFSMDEIWGESSLLIIAGSDALSIAIAACFFYLSHNKGAYERVQNEIRTTFASASEIRHGPALRSCTFLRACIDESMRMSPPVGAALWRRACDGDVRVDDHLIPAGYDVGVGIYAIHHNPRYYPDPYVFKPERWIESKDILPEACSAARAAFQAFSVGPSGCVGKNLAYMELGLTLARVFWSLDFRLATEKEHSSRKEAYLRSYKEHDENEYHLRDRFTSWKDGPMLSFKRR